ncbi:hypothetical protein SAMN04488136_11264 [Vibrio xiamenensis]|uniref:Uncharacterized protein n=1 Tax=Vibrio xiamenensis TaxID=861298 RepID=A0A1G8B1B7_9VIBR|nr:hypothetical protein [Vibrio xiamenensis]SDH26823.1 hypothetical protein SAMN04488136_11264 [Vibrio xiamenensis]
MKYLKLCVLLGYLILISPTSFANQSQPYWELIDTVTLSPSSQKARLSLKKIISRRDFSHIKITCVQGDVDIQSLNIEMTTGEKRDYQTFNILTKGVSTRALSLPGTRQSQLTKLNLSYSNWGGKTLGSFANDKTTKLEVWGLKIQKAPNKKP